MIAPAVVIGGAGEDRAELLRVERMLRTYGELLRGRKEPRD